MGTGVGQFKQVQIPYSEQDTVNDAYFAISDAEACCAACKATANCFAFLFAPGCRLYIEATVPPTSPACGQTVSGVTYLRSDLCVE